MNGYDRDLSDDAVQVEHENPKVFGSGRLIGNNLVLTARHVLRPGGKIVDTDWKVRRIGDRPEDYPTSQWKWHGVTVAWVSDIEDLDLALLQVSDGAELKPNYRMKVAIVGKEDPRVKGIGFATGSEKDGRTDLTVARGTLYHQNRTKLSFGADDPFQPDSPKTSWQGFSGAGIVHSIVRDKRDVWIYGVAEQVPAKFTKNLDVAPLARALSIQRVKDLLAGAQIANFGPADPTLRPAAGEFPDIERIDQFARKWLCDAEIEPMDTRATLCDSFAQVEELHRGGERSGNQLRPSDLMEELAPGRYILLKAPGGFGKTFYLLRMLLAAIERGWVPFFLGLRGKALGQNPGEQTCEALFEAASEPGVSWEIFQKARQKGHNIFIAVDSLNEAGAPEAIEAVLGLLADRYGDRLAMVVTERMSEHLLPFANKHGTVLPLAREMVDARLPEQDRARLGDSFKDLLSIPFFMALYQKISRGAGGDKGRPVFRSRSDIMFAYFALCQDSTINADRMQAKGKDLVSSLAPIAFEGYRDFGVRMKESWLRPKLAEKQIAMDPLVAAGLLVKEDDDVLFSHQLFHDFLAGYQLATGNDPGTGPGAPFWRSANFNIATLALSDVASGSARPGEAKSFDALDFAVELVKDGADEFIIEVYDWNYPAAFHLILNIPEPAGTQTSSAIALRDALIVLNAEKRFDPFRHTRDGARKRAESIGKQVPSNPYNDANLTFDELLKSVANNYNHGGIYALWKRMFLTEAAAPSDWGLLQHSPIVAWTAANAFRRKKLKDEDPLIDYICGLYDTLFERQQLVDSAIGTRWRVAHILGAASGNRIVDKLFEMVGREAGPRETQWVQYGAVRSLVEIASTQTGAADTTRIVSRLAELMGGPIAVQSRAFGQLREAAMPVTPPPWWSGSYPAILDKGIALAHTSREKELWSARSAEVRSSSSSAS